ncbi:MULTISPECIES: hypothetical protein [Microbacterium]|uniref:hypothetical protein n=1 Tax=Microbacterium TaxID=33882 RepID=UPI000B9439F9|nr:MULTISPECIES: hypothetical protein [Microbacterium]MDQ1216464.1 hypothetical protein [Microbacterium arborescens]OYC95445.1 hypothetical protein CI089_12080 [Microbacterium sp. Yaish 1]
MSITARPRTATLAALAVVGALALTGCTPAGDANPSEATPAATTSAPEKSGAASPDAGGDAATTADALAERDAFIAAQQQPVGQPTLTAKTPAQQELVAQQRAHVEANGGQWSEQAETVTLALALDACETSILNGHQVDQNVYQVHVASSPLIQSLAIDDASREGAVSIMVFGTRFLCPDDAPQWEQAWTESSGQ